MPIFRTLLFIVSIAASQAVFANPSIPKNLSFQCITEVPTTSMIAETEAGQIKLQLINHHGVESLPVHSGVITLHDLNYLQGKANVLKELGSSVEMTLTTSSCQFHPDETFSCFGGGPLTTKSGRTFKVVSLSAARVERHSAGLISKEVQLNLTLSSEGEEFWIPMGFTPEECVLQMAQ